jgi:hypothetical protein
MAPCTTRGKKFESCGYAYLRNKRHLQKCCVHSTCTTRPSFGLSSLGRGEGKATHCSVHADRRVMIDVKNAQCQADGCHTQPGYSRTGAPPATHCCRHGKGLLSCRRCAHAPDPLVSISSPTAHDGMVSEGVAECVIAYLREGELLCAIDVLLCTGEQRG